MQGIYSTINPEEVEEQYNQFLCSNECERCCLKRDSITHRNKILNNSRSNTSSCCISKPMSAVLNQDSAELLNCENSSEDWESKRIEVVSKEDTTNFHKNSSSHYKSYDFIDSNICDSTIVVETKCKKKSSSCNDIDVLNK